MLALQTVALRLHVDIAIQLQRTELAVDLNFIRGEIDAVFVRWARCIRSVRGRCEARTSEERAERQARVAAKHGAELRDARPARGARRLLVTVREAAVRVV
jgi:hypothetical protein